MTHLITASVLLAAPWSPILVGGPAGRSEAATTHDQQARTMKISIDANGTRVTATLDDSATSRDFLALLPLTLTLEDYTTYGNAIR